ncbi:MAG TPA: hypothetical protein VES03_04850 [Motilibacterales bacterium]|nr:hypothetical protein [Motilibacterales bacterium]
MAHEITTVKVRRTTRELISRAAHEQQSTIDEYLTRLVTEEQWRQRMELARRLMAAADADYVDETESWDVAAGDGAR